MGSASHASTVALINFTDSCVSLLDFETGKISGSIKSDLMTNPTCVALVPDHNLLVYDNTLTIFMFALEGLLLQVIKPVISDGPQRSFNSFAVCHITQRLILVGKDNNEVALMQVFYSKNIMSSKWYFY